MALQEELGTDFYLFSKDTGYAQQLLLDAHGTYDPDKKTKVFQGQRFVWFCPLGMTNSGGYLADDIIGTRFTKPGYYHSISDQNDAVENYTLAKFKGKAAPSYEQIKGFVDDRKLSVDIAVVRDRTLTMSVTLEDFIKELNKKGIVYNYILCNFCRESSKINGGRDNEWDVHQNPKTNMLSQLPHWN